MPQGGVVELISRAILTGGGVRIPLEGCLASHALSGVGEVMLREAHTDPNETIENPSASAFDAGGCGAVPACSGWAGDALIIRGAHGCLWGADAGECVLIVYEGCGAAFELQRGRMDAAAVV